MAARVWLLLDAGEPHGALPRRGEQRTFDVYDVTPGVLAHGVEHGISDYDAARPSAGAQFCDAEGAHVTP